MGKTKTITSGQGGDGRNRAARTFTSPPGTDK
jgi:hypothetical protein